MPRLRQGQVPRQSLHHTRQARGGGQALVRFYPELAQVKLVDYQVWVLDEKQGTSAKVRVLVESSDSRESWSTVGVSENIIEASWQALRDSLNYKLFKSARAAQAVQTPA